MTQGSRPPRVVPFSSSFPSKAPVAPGEPGVQPVTGPSVSVSVVETGASR